jgi:hypothetical protein
MMGAGVYGPPPSRYLMPSICHLRSALIELDRRLTFNAFPEKMALDQQTTICNFILGGLYYLSDGGYSRVFWGIPLDESGVLCLATESSDLAKFRWTLPDVVSARCDVEWIVRMLIREMGG